MSDPLDSILTSYSGPGLIQRLIYLSSIASGKSYQITCLEHIINTIKLHSKSIELYQEQVKKLSKLDPQNPFSKEDTKWISQISDEVELKCNQLDLSIRSFQNSNKYDEVLRLSTELGDYYMSMNDYLSAQRYYRTAIDACQDKEEDDGVVIPSVLFHCKIAETTILSKQWSYTKNVCSRILNHDKGIDVISIIKLKIMYGLSCLALGDFEESAGMFLKIDEEGTENLQLAIDSVNLIKLQDIGLFITLCSLATLSRENLKFMIDKDSIFIKFTDDTPYLRNLISSFLDVKYQKFFSLWNDLSDFFKADLYIGPHYASLYSLIRERAYDQYLSVYKTIPIGLMQQLFSTDGDSSTNSSAFIAELSSFIDKSKSNMRINELNSEITLCPENEYTNIYNQTESLAKDYIHDSHSLLWAIHSMRLPDVEQDEKCEKRK